MVEVIFTDEFAAWWDDLTEGQQENVAVKVGLLAQLGVGLGHPHSSAILGSKVALRELRVQSGGHPLRVFYVFDAERQAVLLVGGDKTGRDRFYEEMIPVAERVYAEYLEETGQGKG